VECEFKEVERRPEALRVLGYATWFYRPDPFPVFQCIYPDLKNNFPWEESFDASWRKRQPLLFVSAESTRLERDFWAFHDSESSLYRWQFSDSPHTGVYTTKRIMNKEEPITYVTHDLDDGAWQFHGPSDSPPESAILVCLHCILDWDPSIASLHDLPLGWQASRENPSSPWTREPLPPGESKTE
jgi:hypothetical protein